MALCDPRSHVQLLYERAIADFPLTVDLWQAFLAFCEHTLHIPAITSAGASSFVSVSVIRLPYSESREHRGRTRSRQKQRNKNRKMEV